MQARDVRPLLLAAVLLAAPLYLVARAPLAQRPAQAGLGVLTQAGLGGKAPPVELVFYGEALCPDCARFTSNILAPLFVTGVSSIFSLRYVGWGNAYRKGRGAVECQHGPRECELNRMLNCAQELSSNQDAFIRFLVCVEDNLFGGRDGDELLSACAGAANLNAAAVGECANGPRGAPEEP